MNGKPYGVGDLGPGVPNPIIKQVKDLQARIAYLEGECDKLQKKLELSEMERERAYDLGYDAGYEEGSRLNEENP